MDSVVHFEMPYEKRDRMAKFYQSAFGWQTQMLGEEMGNYVIAITTDTGERGQNHQAPLMAASTRRNRNGPRNIRLSLSP